MSPKLVDHLELLLMAAEMPIQTAPYILTLSTLMIRPSLPEFQPTTAHFRVEPWQNMTCNQLISGDRVTLFFYELMRTAWGAEWDTLKLLLSYANLQTKQRSELLLRWCQMGEKYKGWGKRRRMACCGGMVAWHLERDGGYLWSL